VQVRSAFWPACERGQARYTTRMDSSLGASRDGEWHRARVRLARDVLAMLAHGHSIPFIDAMQLRAWAIERDDALLPLGDIALRILAADRETGETE